MYMMPIFITEKRVRERKEREFQKKRLVATGYKKYSLTVRKIKTKILWFYYVCKN